MATKNKSKLEDTTQFCLNERTARTDGDF